MITKNIIIGILGLLLFACNIPKEGEQDNIPTSKLEAITALADIDTAKVISKNLNNIAKPLLIARGSEPGWYAEFFQDHLNLFLNNGIDSLHLEGDFSKINTNKVHYISGKAYKSIFLKNRIKNNEDSGVVVTIVISDKNCTEEASGEKKKKVFL